jgi:hypothetical protein
MQRRLKVHGATRRGRLRRKSQWLDGAALACGERLGVHPCAEIGTAAVDLFTLVENPFDALPGVVGQTSEVTVVRIVGEIFIVSEFVNTTSGDFSATSLLVAMGIYIADTSNAVPITRDPADIGDMNSKDWLWRGTTCFAQALHGIDVATQTNTRDCNHEGSGAHIDVRVKRKLHQDESIMLAMSASLEHLSGSNTAADATVYANIRALVLLP